MKQYILKTLLFLAALGALLLSIVLMTNYYIDKKANFKLSGDVHSIILGHSHSEMAYNDSLIDGFKNLGHSAESYFYGYYKLKKVISQNPQIKTVYLEFSNNQIEATMDEWTWGEEFVSFRYPIYSSFIDMEGQRLLATHNNKSYFGAMSKATYNNLEWLAKKDFNFLKRMGGYEHTKRTALDSLLATDFENNPQYVYSKSKLSSENLKYAQKIIAYCKANDLDVKLIRTPQYPRLPVLRNEKRFQQVKDSLFNDLEFLDFNDFELNVDEFSDLDHLNYKGARRFSGYFNKFISNHNTNKR
ncbi:MAG: hypothetical protein WA749_03280 [Gelidibacter sp.]